MTQSGTTPLEEGVPLLTIEVSGIPQNLLWRLDERARERGSDRSEVIRELLARELGSEDVPVARRGFDAVLEPIRAGFAESGMREEEAEALLEDGLRAVRAERREADDLKPVERADDRG